MSKFFLYMGCLQALFATITIAATGSAQALEKTYVTYNWQNLKLEEAFSDIQNQTDFFFTFDRTQVSRISVSGAQEHTALADLLKYISSKTGLMFRITKDLILVKYDDDSAAATSMLDKNIAILVSDDEITQLIDAKSTKVIYEVGLAEINEDQIVRGTVTSTDGEALIGATVVVKETGQNTVTDNSGNFTIAIPDEGAATLVVSYIGYQTREIAVSGQTQMDIQLAVASTELDEVVVVGYGTQKKINLTGAVSTIKSSDIQNRPITQASQSLYGLVPGVFLNANTGEAGNDQATIRVRGIGTLNDANPLILVDGIEAPINNINPNDIESINVLKDAASAAIYGSRAANGVILITTKRGDFEKKPTISYDAFGGFAQPTVLPEMVTDNRQYLELYREAAINSNRPVRFTDADIERYANLPSTDWLDVVFRDQAPIQQHSLAFNGGSSNVSYRLSLGYLDQAGLLDGNYGLERYNSRLNLDVKINERLTVGTSFAYAVENGNLSAKSGPEFGGLEVNNLNGKGSMEFEAALTNHPNIPIFDEQGRYATVEQTLGLERTRYNAQALLDNYELLLDRNDFYGNAYAEYKILEGLKVRGTVGLNTEQLDFTDRRIAYGLYDWVTGEQINLIAAGGGLDFDQLVENINFSQNVTLWLQGTYEKSFGSHNFSLLAGFNQETARIESATTRQVDFGTSSLVTLGNGATTTDAIGTTGEWGLRSYFGRLKYDFANKYLLEANFRVDGSSRFGASNRWATFPSFSAAWIVSNENFWGNNFIDFLKIRASWGQLGNQNTALYPFAAQFAVDENYVLGDGLNSGGALTRLGNPDLRWEETTQTDIGINIGLWNSKILLEADYFFRETDDILTEIANPLVTGITQSTIVNAASIENRGWEASLSYQEKIGDLNIRIGGNVTNVTNEVTAINPELSAGEDVVNIGGNLNIFLIRGEPINSIFGYKTAGIFQTSEEIASAPDHSLFGNPEPGDFRIADLNGDGVINPDDRTVIGNREPEWLYGFNLDLEYKGFDFSAIFQGIGKADFFSYRLVGPFPFGGLREVWVDRWTPENPSPDRPRIWIDRRGYNGSLVQSNQSSFWVENRAYLRLKNIQLGYTLPQSLFRSNFIENLRIYINAQNLWTSTDLKDFDPERISTERQISTSLPQNKVFTAGINLTF